MSDIDIQLIKEFALRPIIYNKTTPFFKNKYLTDCAWDEIAAKVNCDVGRVRDRVNQLRNRYNLEKRKVDIRKAEGYSNARSTWPLFDNLRFLDGHIRPRKSYKCMIRRVRPVGRPRRNHRQDDFVLYNEEAHPTQYANPVALHQQGFQIKYEPDAIGSGSGGGHNDSNMYNSGYESDDDGNGQGNSTSSRQNGERHSDNEQFINPATFLVEDGDTRSKSPRNDQPEHSGQTNNTTQFSANSEAAQDSPNVTLRSIDSLKHQQASTNGIRSATNNAIIPVDSESQSSLQNQSYTHNAIKYYRSPIAKFEAFGNFVVSSLADMPEQKALELVEKFTSDIVKTLIAKSKE